MNEKKERKRKLERELSYIDAVSNKLFFIVMQFNESYAH